MTKNVSVIVPVYNRFELTRRAVASVLAQTIPVSDVILIDDGSSDGTSELLSHQVLENPEWRGRVHYFHQHNQGQSAARNAGIQRATGEWLAFIDNDDLWLPQKLEWQFKALEKYEGTCDVCITDAWFMNNPNMKMTLFGLAGKQHSRDISFIEDARKYLLDSRTADLVPSIWVQNLVVRTTLARRLGGFDVELRYTEDADFAFRLASETSFCVVGMPMVLIDRSPDEQRHVGESKKWDAADFRLTMTQRRLEKRLGMLDSAPRELTDTTYRQLAAVYSEWANWHLERGQVEHARNAAYKAVRAKCTYNTALKLALVYCAPKVLNRLVALRSRSRNQELQNPHPPLADKFIRL